MPSKASVDIVYKNRIFRKIVNSHIYPEELGFQIVEDIRYLQNSFEKDEIEHLLQNIVEIKNAEQITEKQVKILRRFLPHPITFQPLEQGILKTIMYGFILTYSKKELYHYTVNFDTHFFTFEAKTNLYSHPLDPEDDATFEQYSFDNLTLFMERYGNYR